MSDNKLMFSLDQNLQVKWVLVFKLLVIGDGRNHLKG
jgi:hypothetical protein